MSWIRAHVSHRILVLVSIGLVLFVIAFMSLPDPLAQHPQDKFQPISIPYSLGTDHLGRDLTARLFFGLLYSLLLISLTLVSTLVIGLFLGLLAARNVLAESFFDVIGGAVWSLPTLIVCLLVFVGLKGQWIEAKFILLGLFNWVPIYRVVRDSAKQIQVRPFVTFLRAMGMKERSIYFTHILPNILPALLPSILLNIVSLFEAEFFISFLGLSYPDPIPTLGSVLRQGFAYLNLNMILLPSLLIGIIVLLIIIKYQRTTSFGEEIYVRHR